MPPRDKCLDLSVIPQFSGTCWFNAILMIALYSENVRKVLMKASMKWDKSNSFLMTLKRILFVYYKKKDANKVQEFYSRIKPENILFKMIKKYDDKMVHFFRNELKNKEDIRALGYSPIFIINFFKYIGINTLDVFYSKRGGFFLNIDKEIEHSYTSIGYEVKLKDNIKKYNKPMLFKKGKEVFDETTKILQNVPDIIVLKHEDLVGMDVKDYVYHYLVKNVNEYKSSNYNFDVKGLDTYQDIIYLNGHKYKLDASTLQNYNKGSYSHAIAGITCNGNRYVYNGWNEQTTDPTLRKAKIGLTSPCSLMKYDWNVRKDESFCLNQKTCKLDFIVDPNDLCFSFAKSKRFLVYARIDDDSDKISKGKIPLKTPELSGVSGIIKRIHDIDKLTDEELRDVITKNFKQYRSFMLSKYDTEALRKLYYDLLVEYYNIKPAKVVKEKPLLKKDLIELIKKQKPHLKGLAKLKKAQLETLLSMN